MCTVLFRRCFGLRSWKHKEKNREKELLLDSSSDDEPEPREEAGDGASTTSVYDSELTSDDDLRPDHDDILTDLDVLSDELDDGALVKFDTNDDNDCLKANIDEVIERYLSGQSLVGDEYENSADKLETATEVDETQTKEIEANETIVGEQPQVAEQEGVEKKKPGNGATVNLCWNISWSMWNHIVVVCKMAYKWILCSTKRQWLNFPSFDWNCSDILTIRAVGLSLNTYYFIGHEIGETGAHTL